MPDDVWVDERIVVGPSAIEGQGLFAIAAIDEDVVVIRLGGRLVSSGELASLIADAKRDSSLPYVDSVTVDEGAHLVLPPATTAHFGNHSCDPNLWHVSTVELATRRPVAAGDEVTVDYGTNSGADGFVMDCRCGTAVCRQRVTSDDWRRPELAARYRGHWTPAPERRIAALRTTE